MLIFILAFLVIKINSQTITPTSSSLSGTTELICGPNEIAQECRPCDKTCNNTNPICPLAPCILGVKYCHCLPDYVRDSNNLCIPVKQCNSTCPPNEQFMPCGTACERTCDRPNPTICTLQCILNVCQCKEGYVRNKNNTCVLPQECPPRNCSRNEEWRNCSSCDGTCWNPNTICTQQCRPPRCQCRQGFVRNWLGQCVRPNSTQCWPWWRRNRKISSTIQETVPFPIPQYQNPCATVLCASNTTCFSVCPYNCPQDTSCSSRAACLPNNITTCASVICNMNESCIMQEVICIRAPCYPVPTCVPKNHHCALKNCPFNQVPNDGPNEEQEDV